MVQYQFNLCDILLKQKLRKTIETEISRVINWSILQAPQLLLSYMTDQV